MKLNHLGQFLGSIKLAVPLLGAIATILIFTTFYESEVGSAVVQQEIYKSPWFGALMFLLALNLGISTLSRYPWRGARKLGFAITHWGLVVIIAGSAAVIHLSVEGMLLARTDAGPVSSLRVEGDLLEVAAPGQEPQQASLFIKSDGTVVPNRVGNLSLLGYSDRAIKTVHFETGAAVDNPAVRLRLSSDRMGQTLDRWLAAAPAAYRQIDIGPAELQIVKADSPQALRQALTAPAENPNNPWGTLQVSWAGVSRTIDVRSQLGQTSQIGSGELKLLGFWPDFRLDSNRQPETASPQFRNPAVQLELANGETTERWFVFSNPAFEPVRAAVQPPDFLRPIAADIRYEAPVSPEPDAFFRVVVDAQGSLHYAARASQGFKSGPLAVGEAIAPGWADFEITLAEYLPQAQVKRATVPLPETAPADSGEPALLVAVGAEEPVWVPWGEPTTVSTPAGDWYVAFSPKLLQLPFAVKLNDFIVERNEGSESVAMWTSAVTLMEPHTGERADRRVWMNHPTWFKGWKIAQASWNPGDLSQSTLQVKREPWWVTGLTWLGSLMVIVGVGTMFYGRSVAKKLRVVADLLGMPEVEERESVGTIPIMGFFLGR
ncbi:cytochrome c biogenesis protein ResB [Romeria aff. gracilis LEGE 07310]|uniref:Cytochrome c biogenesis protein ResB n=1 Tax=Vasconcelosia minhoensis LEGE 07310 TaxID=915328 RepID=A0A8J7ATZ9_9CYAN|nr:cytochrome c biogenesis protein ResB [Romeria gracilis]MBE9076578.1 cytochrome c biogenesis protein ResB [Romeria aff. gracilis LEGE 07310]